MPQIQMFIHHLKQVQQFIFAESGPPTSLLLHLGNHPSIKRDFTLSQLKNFFFDVTASSFFQPLIFFFYLKKTTLYIINPCLQGAHYILQRGFETSIMPHHPKILKTRLSSRTKTNNIEMPAVPKQGTKRQETINLTASKV